MASSPTHRREVTPLKLAVIASGRDQQDIAAEIGMHPSHLSRIVRGLHTDEVTRQKIASSIGRKVSDLWPALDEREAA
jgi:hypothetical protein